MQEELTAEMHAEFWVDPETDLKHRVWAVVRLVENGTYSLKEALSVFGVSIEDYNKLSGSMPRD